MLHIRTLNIQCRTMTCHLIDNNIERKCIGMRNNGALELPFERIHVVAKVGDDGINLFFKLR